MSKEQYYDENIAPKLVDLCNECKEHGLSLLAVCEWEPGKYGSTRLLQQKSGYGIQLADMASRASGNVDSLIMAMIRHAREHGHNSIFLRQLGVPMTPDNGNGGGNE